MRLIRIPKRIQIDRLLCLSRFASQPSHRLGALLLLVMATAACGGGTGAPPGVGPAVNVKTAIPNQAGPGPANLPTALPKIPSPSTHADSSKSLGIAQASEILMAKTNPFLVRLPKIQVDTPSTGVDTTAAAPLPPDPFEGINLLGIVASGKKSIALLSTGSDATGNQLVRPGDLVTGGTGLPLKVRTISNNAVELELTGTTPERRTIHLPDIVGYHAAGKGEVETAESNEQPGSILQLPSLPGMPMNTPKGKLKLEEL